MFRYKYARPALTVDAVLFGLDDTGLKLLLIERAHDPFAGCWALPGGFVDVGESPDDAVRRELEEETGLSGIYLEQLYTFGRPDRDPREHVVSVAYYGLVNIRDHDAQAATDARQTRWMSVAAIDAGEFRLAFDHAEILAMAIERLRGKVRYRPIGFELLPPRFTLSQLRHVYETILGESLDKRNFRKRVQALGLLTPLGEYEEDVARRPGQLYTFDEARYLELSRGGFEFRL